MTNGALMVAVTSLALLVGCAKGSRGSASGGASSGGSSAAGASSGGSSAAGASSGGSSAAGASSGGSSGSGAGSGSGGAGGTTGGNSGAGANIDGNLSGNLATAPSKLHLATVRDAHDDPNLVQHEQAALAAGLQPLIIMFGCSVSDPATRLSDNKTLLSQIHQIFGTKSVWWELGNEQDLQCGFSASQYTAMWNGQIPTLKSLYPQDLFGGPVNFQYNPPYVASFVQNATPTPDFISWHEYTCSSSSSNSYCLQHIANWTTHITTTRQDITATGKSVPPIFITEYNYAPDGNVCSDSKHNDSTFMSQWTTTALQTLAQNGVAASYQFDTSNCLPLETNNGTLTPQGQAFANFW